jgi:predicted DNA binding protein
MTENYFNEDWKTVDLGEKIKPEYQFEVSNYGRVRRIRKDAENEFSKLGTIEGYYSIGVKQTTGKSTNFYVHRLVAAAFLKPETEKHKFVIHLDFNKLNNRANNLKWATQKEVREHQENNPKWIKTKGRISNSKLTETQVRRLKMKILDPERKTRYKILAKQFGISEMQLYRIKIGVHWGHIHVDVKQRKEKK